MKTTLTTLTLALAALTALPIHALEERRSTAADQTGLAVTIYNGNLALVKDARKVKLGGGENRLAWREVSARMQPETALLHTLDGSALTLLEQNFDFDLLTPQSLLEKSVGSSVKVIRNLPVTGTEFVENATILAANNGVVLQFIDRVETGIPGRMAFPSVPPDLRDRPTLAMLLKTDGPANPMLTSERQLELTYLTGGLTWKADYVAELSDKEDRMDLSGWVTLTNTSGTSYPNARLQLVAGQVNRAQPEPIAKQMMARAMAMAEAAPAMQEEGLFEYHLYTLPRNTTLGDNQTKQVALLSAQDVAITKEYRLDGANWYYTGQHGDLGQKLKPGVFVEFGNQDKESGGKLGVPLPKGVVRVYKKDSAGRAQFVGEDRIDHTAKGEVVRLKLGEAFDITADKKQTDYQKLAAAYNSRTGVIETAYQLEIRNAKSEAVTVKVVEPMPGEWQMVQESQPHVKDAAHTATWVVPVPADGKAVLSWRVRIRY
ncbi:MAG TPA: DUF4139 domain-containing protein [Thiobacillaceae bacterium]|nr:DUF4139 domain-containing protein [Thiobacillaceae bacterium]HNU64688.1 DUF4139 domain-containing protein [Thiobacillaceae bacterium]